MSILAPSPKTLANKTKATSPMGHELPPPAQHVVLYGLSWQDYIQIGNVLCDRPALRLTFNQGTLEIMVTSPEHEKYKSRFGPLIDILAEEFELQIEPAGNMTFQREDMEKGLEGDNCWWIEHEELVRGKLTWDAAVDPPPDLILEIEVSRTAVARMPIYAQLRVPQVWCFDGESLRVNVLQHDATYLQVSGSPTFPGIPLAEIVRFVLPQKTKAYLTILKEFRAWVKRQRKGTRNSKKGKSK